MASVCRYVGCLNIWQITNGEIKWKLGESRHPESSINTLWIATAMWIRLVFFSSSAECDMLPYYSTYGKKLYRIWLSNPLKSTLFYTTTHATHIQCEEQWAKATTASVLVLLKLCTCMSKVRDGEMVKILVLWWIKKARDNTTEKLYL